MLQPNLRRLPLEKGEEVRIARVFADVLVPRTLVGQVDEGCCVHLGEGALHLFDAVVDVAEVGRGRAEVVAGKEILGHVVLAGRLETGAETHGAGYQHYIHEILGNDISGTPGKAEA